MDDEKLVLSICPLPLKLRQKISNVFSIMFHREIYSQTKFVQNSFVRNHALFEFYCVKNVAILYLHLLSLNSRSSTRISETEGSVKLYKRLI